MAENPKKNQRDDSQQQSSGQDSAQEWFEYQDETESDELRNAREWETDHRLVDDNTALGNIHQGSDETQDLTKSQGSPSTTVSEIEGVVLPDSESAQPRAEVSGAEPLAEEQRASEGDVAAVGQEGEPDKSSEAVGPQLSDLSLDLPDDLVTAKPSEADPEQPSSDRADSQPQSGTGHRAATESSSQPEVAETVAAGTPTESPATTAPRITPDPEEEAAAQHTQDVNEKPTAEGKETIKSLEDQEVVLTTDTFGFQDQDGDQLSAVRLVDPLENGALYLHGVAVGPGQAISAADIEAGNLSYRPDNHGSGENFDTATFQVSDGNQWSDSTAEISFDVTPVADAPELDVSFGTAQRVDVPGTGEIVDKTITTQNYQQTDGGFRVLGRTVDAEGNLSEATLENVGTGQNGFAPQGTNAGPDYQLGVNLEHQVSEELIIELDQATAEASVTIGRLFASEHGSEGHEAGFYTLKNGDEVVGHGSFHSTSGNQMQLDLSGDNGVSFDQIVFTAKTTYEDGSIRGNDASDYVVRAVSWKTEEQMDQVWETSLNIGTELVDGDQSEILEPVIISGLPPGAQLSAGTMISGGTPAEFQATNLQIAHESPARIVFEGETAGYRNSLGYYKIDPETGKITDVEMLWENASLKGSGGDLIKGESTLDIDISAGDQVGFFLVADGARKNNFDNLEEGHFEFRESDGSAASATSSVPELVFVAKDGSESVIKGNIYHTAENDENLSLNPDGIRHTRGDLDLDDGKITIGFEDLKGGGDRDFDDSIFTVELGAENVEQLAYENGGYSTWEVDPSELEGLTMTIPGEYQDSFDLSVTSAASEVDGGTASTAVSLTVNVTEDGVAVEDVQTEVIADPIEVSGVSMQTGSSGEDDSSNLNQFAATEENGNGLSDSLNSFSTASSSSDEDVPSLDEQVAAAEQEEQEAQENGLNEAEVLIVEENGGSNGEQEDVTPVV